MAYTDRAGKIIIAAFGTFKALLGATVVPGDLLAPDASGDAFILGDEDAPAAAFAVAVTGGNSGDTIEAALGVVFEAPPTGNPPTAQTLAASTDIGSPLYLSATGGKASLSQGGTTVQQVGYVLSTTQVLLVPGQYLTGTTQTLSGALTVGGVTALNDTVTVATNKKVQLRDTGIFLQSAADGKVTLSADGTGVDDITLEGSIATGEMIMSDVQATVAVSADKTLALADCGVVQLVDTDAKTVTLPATAIGLCYKIMNNAADGASIVTISPDVADKISGAGLTPADNKDLINTKATAKKGDYVVLLADGVDGWVVIDKAGTWAREA